MTFDTFLEAAWNDHADHPQKVADTIAASFQLVEAPAQLARFVGLLTHVYGEHLGQWQRGVELLESLRGLPAYDGSAAVAGPVARSQATLRYVGGDASALSGLDAQDSIMVLASASSAFAGRGEFSHAIAAYEETLGLAQAGLPPGSPAIRVLAVGGNNLAAALEEKKDRTGPETTAMLAAAQGGLTYWKQSGTWLEEERAEYRLARSQLQAGQSGAAVASGQRCVQVCERNDAPAFELFFAHTVLALAHRAAGDAGAFSASRQRALECLEQVPPEEKVWCESDLKELQR